jgi:membrane protease subunit HflC
MRFPLTIVVVTLILVLILVGYASTYTVEFHQIAVKKHLGRADETSVVREPGLYLKWPIVDKVDTFDTRLQTLDTPETETKTIDGKNLIVGSYALWTIEDPLRFLNRAGTAERAMDHMRSRVIQAQTAAIGQSTLSDFVGLDPNQVEENYNRILKQMQDEVAPQLAADYGVRLRKLGIRRISLPKEATQQVFDSMRQERKVLATKYEQEGKARYEGIKARATQAEQQILAFVDRRAQEISSAGVEAASHILAQIPAEDREFFEWLRWLDGLSAAFKQRTTFFIDQNSIKPLWEAFTRPPVATQPASQRVR